MNSSRLINSVCSRFNRYYDAGTPCSSLSPASSSCLQSPASFTLDSPSPPPTTQDHCDFLHAGPFESDFNKLTLTGKRYFFISMYVWMQFY